MSTVPGTWLHRRLPTTGELTGSGAVAVVALVAMERVGARIDRVSPSYRSSALSSVAEVWHPPHYGRGRPLPARGARFAASWVSS